MAARNPDNALDDKKDIKKLFKNIDVQDKLLIVDDRTDVWSSSLYPNIIKSNYYDYLDVLRESIALNQKAKFPTAAANSFFPNTSNNTSKNNDLSYHNITNVLDYDRQLYFLANLLEEAHARYQKYSSANIACSLPKILKNIYQTILSDCVVFLSGYHRSDQVSQYGMLDNVWINTQKLTGMGAKVVDTLSDEVTHVIVVRPSMSTERARSICSENTKFVHNLWIYACEQAWVKIEEELFDPLQVFKIFSKPSVKPHHDHWCITYKSNLIKKKVMDDLSAKKNINNAENALMCKLKHKSWPATVPSSEGNVVWSMHENIIMYYDPFLTSELTFQSFFPQ